MTKRDAGRQESADQYPHVVAQLGPKWRIIECRDGEQWLLQHRSNKWESRAYCRTSAALRRVIREHVGDVELPELPAWLKQPARFKNGARVDFDAVEAHSPALATKSRPAALSDSSSGRLSPCGQWRFWGPELSERSLRFATLAWNDNIVPPGADSDTQAGDQAGVALSSSPWRRALCRSRRLKILRPRRARATATSASTNGPVGGTWERRRHQRDLEQRAKDRNSHFRSML